MIPDDYQKYATDKCIALEEMLGKHSNLFMGVKSKVLDNLKNRGRLFSPQKLTQKLLDFRK